MVLAPREVAVRLILARAEQRPISNVREDTVEEKFGMLRSWGLRQDRSACLIVANLDLNAAFLVEDGFLLLADLHPALAAIARGGLEAYGPPESEAMVLPGGQEVRQDFRAASLHAFGPPDFLQLEVRMRSAAEIAEREAARAVARAAAAAAAAVHAPVAAAAAAAVAAVEAAPAGCLPAAPQ